MNKERKDMERFLKQVYNSVNSEAISNKQLSNEIDKHWTKEWKEWIKTTADNNDFKNNKRENE